MSEKTKDEQAENVQIPLEALVRRTIKFRGRDAKTGEWIYGYYYKYDGNWIKDINRKGYDTMVTAGSVCQFTGLTDKKGKGIYEGDIVEIPGWGSGVIKFDRGRFGAQNEEELFYWLGFCKVDHSSYECEVIGNIFDNPELL